ncbi:DedA family protein [Alsobacter sp. SYSU M60028]|uniref:DedA family protein n=1 Tax=Alsobacter ponti TaxID=2962936 RepID=A0ABT1LBE3_9HYPH|nr:YqaA family protein [Alsobacter ponti]MCP8938806.1 DedA family protein [Alsobacter ponti]
MLELAGLFTAAFLSATLLPGSSELAFVGLLATGRVDLATALAVATVGNTLGSCANWAVGRFLAAWRDHPRFPVKPDRFDRYCDWYRRYGLWSLLLSWTPVIGDPLTVIAGVFRTPLWLFTPIVAFAKLARYLAVAGVVRLAV